VACQCLCKVVGNVVVYVWCLEIRIVSLNIVYCLSSNHIFLLTVLRKLRRQCYCGLKLYYTYLVLYRQVSWIYHAYVLNILSSVYAITHISCLCERWYVEAVLMILVQRGVGSVSFPFDFVLYIFIVDLLFIAVNLFSLFILIKFWFRIELWTWFSCCYVSVSCTQSETRLRAVNKRWIFIWVHGVKQSLLIIRDFLYYDLSH